MHVPARTRVRMRAERRLAATEAVRDTRSALRGDGRESRRLDAFGMGSIAPCWRKGLGGVLSTALARFDSGHRLFPIDREAIVHYQLMIVKRELDAE